MFRKFADLFFVRFENLSKMWQFANLRFADLRTKFFGGLKTFTNPQMHNFYPNKYKLKMLSFKFKDDS
jgi:hypothetical protein